MANRPYFHTVGKRKTAIARVRLYENGAGKVKVNGLELKDYLHGTLVENALAPLEMTGRRKTVDVEVAVEGGGKSAQSDAIRLGISRAILLIDAGQRPTLKSAGFLRRDSRIKERKKPGLHRARRAPQFAKR